jgi:diphosphomevalonate decarboxylase
MPAARAHPNIALIKYWGNANHALRIPSNGSISMNLAGLETRTTVRFNPQISGDHLTLNGQPAPEAAHQRVSAMLERVRQLSGLTSPAEVESANNFPMGTGIASSASSMAALALAASAAAGLELSERELSILARTGSGSAARSVPGGFVEWQAGSSHADSFAFSLAPAEHWALADCIAVISAAHKATGSSEGHPLADTSPLQPARVADTPRRLDLCRRALLTRDFAALAEVVEHDNLLMHAVMMTSRPPLLYWQPATLAVLHAVAGWRAAGIAACATIDAGPNVHVLCTAENAAQVARRLAEIPGVAQVLQAVPGGPARLV